MYTNHVNKVHAYFSTSGFPDVLKMTIERSIILQAGTADCFVDDCLEKKKQGNNDHAANVQYYMQYDLLISSQLFVDNITTGILTINQYHFLIC